MFHIKQSTTLNILHNCFKSVSFVSEAIRIPSFEPDFLSNCYDLFASDVILNKS